MTSLRFTCSLLHFVGQVKKNDFCKFFLYIGTFFYFLIRYRGTVPYALEKIQKGARHIVSFEYPQLILVFSSLFSHR